MTTNSVFNITERVMRQASRIRQALGDADLNNSQAEAATDAAGYRIGRNRIAQLRAGEVEPKDVELHIIAKVTGADERFVRGEEYVFVSSNAFHDLNRAIPGYVNPDTHGGRLSRRILKTDHTQRFHCFDCLLDPNFHVTAEWTEPGGAIPQIPGQTEIVIELEKMLEEVA